MTWALHDLYPVRKMIMMTRAIDWYVVRLCHVHRWNVFSVSDANVRYFEPVWSVVLFLRRNTLFLRNGFDRKMSFIALFCRWFIAKSSFWHWNLAHGARIRIHTRRRWRRVRVNPSAYLCFCHGNVTSKIIKLIESRRIWWNQLRSGDCCNQWSVGRMGQLLSNTIKH